MAFERSHLGGNIVFIVFRKNIRGEALAENTSCVYQITLLPSPTSPHNG